MSHPDLDHTPRPRHRRAASSRTSAPTHPPPTAPATSRRHGIDVIPPAERHGRPRELFWVWMSANVVYLYFVLGGVLVLLGLSIWEALAITVVGNLWWAAVGWLAVSGPASGAPSVAIMRAMFGVRGNRVFGGGLGVAIGLFYEIINIAVATLAANALLGWFGIAAARRRRVGRARRRRRAQLRDQRLRARDDPRSSHRGSRPRSPWRSSCSRSSCFGAADFSYAPAPLPERRALGDGAARLRDRRLGPAVVGHRRRLRPVPAARHVSKRQVAWWTALGGFIPAVLIGTLGVVAATAIDMTDPQLTIGEIVPAWFTPIFLAIVVLGSITNNVLVAYSTGLYAQGLGIRVSRAATVVVTGVARDRAGGLVRVPRAELPRHAQRVARAQRHRARPARRGLRRRHPAAPQPLRRRRARRRAPRRAPFWYRGGVVLARRDRDGRRHHGRRAHGQHDALRRPDRGGARRGRPVGHRRPVLAGGALRRALAHDAAPTATRRARPRATRHRCARLPSSKRMPRHPPRTMEVPA